VLGLSVGHFKIRAIWHGDGTMMPTGNDLFAAYTVFPLVTGVIGYVIALVITKMFAPVR
jgi:hypothetical protein